MKLVLKIINFLIAFILSIILIQKLVPFFTSNSQLKVLVGETLFACAALFWFTIFHKYWDREDLKNSVLFPKSGIVFFLFWGLLFGSCLIFLTFAISISTGVLRVTYLSIKGMELTKIIFISIAATVLTAFWEELAFRGFILKKLITGIGPHRACLLVALIFGFLHLLSPVKSINIVISTIFAGLLLNYAFLYCENPG